MVANNRLNKTTEGSLNVTLNLTLQLTKQMLSTPVSS